MMVFTAAIEPRSTIKVVLPHRQNPAPARRRNSWDILGARTPLFVAVIMVVGQQA